MVSLDALMLSGTANVLYALVFISVGIGMQRRFSAHVMPFAAHAFVAWWYVMAAQAVTVALMQLSTAFDVVSAPLAATLFMLSILFAAVQIWTLGHYILFIWAGDQRRNVVALVIFSAAYFLYFMLLWNLVGNHQLRVGAWAVGLDVGLTQSQMAVTTTLFFLPFFGLISAYVMLAFEAPSNTQRVRVLVLGTAASLWNIGQVSQFATAATTPPAFGGVLVALNLVWAGILLATYYPPRAIQRWFGIESLHAEARSRPRDL
jgi:hypothetical protein